MDKQLTTIDFSDRKMIDTLKSTVAQGLTDPEFALFAEFCRSTALNPFKREIWAIKAGGRLQLMTGLNGFLAIANAHPQFDGMECIVDNDEAPTKAVCKVWRKDRKFPSEGVAMMKEYRKDTPIWRQMPRVMLTKVAKSIAIREAFPQELGGLYTQEEMPGEFSEPKQTVQKVKTTPIVAAGPFFYDVPTPTKAQQEYLEKHCSFDQEIGLWVCDKQLGEKLAKYMKTGPKDVKVSAAFDADTVPEMVVLESNHLSKSPITDPDHSDRGATAAGTQPVQEA